jgi:hypothetical protein
MKRIASQIPNDIDVSTYVYDVPSELLSLIFDYCIDAKGTDILFLFLRVSNIWKQCAHELIKNVPFDLKIKNCLVPTLQEEFLINRLIIHFYEDESLDDFFDASTLNISSISNEHLKNFTNLTELNLDSSHLRISITDAGIKELTNLLALNLSSCCSITNLGMIIFKVLLISNTIHLNPS